MRVFGWQAADGRIDLKPQEPFQVVPGGVLGIRLDMDANKSLNLHERGKGGKKGYIFRPVVFVDIEDRAPDGRCPKILGGTIKELVEEGGQTVGFKLDLIHDRGEIEVRLTPGTEIFDNTGFTNANALQTGQEVKVRGKFDSICRVVASLVVIGDVLDVTGEVYSAVNNGLFRFTPNLDEAVFPGQETNVGVTEGQTLILIDCDTAVSPSAIQPGMTARVFGKLVGVQNGSVLQAAVIFLRQKQVTGEIINLATDANGNKTAVIQQKDGAHATVFIPAMATVYIERDGTMSVDRLCVGQEVRVILAPGSGNPPNAQVVYVEGARHEGQVVSVNTFSRTLVV